MKKVIRFIVTMSVVLITTISCDETMTEYQCKWHGVNKNDEKIDTSVRQDLSFLDENGYWKYYGYGFMVVKNRDDSNLITVFGPDPCKRAEPWFKKNGITILKKGTKGGYHYYTLYKKSVYTGTDRYFFMEFKTKDGNWIKYTEHPFLLENIIHDNMLIGVRTTETRPEREWFKKNEITHIWKEVKYPPNYYIHNYIIEYVNFNCADIKCVEEASGYLS